MVRADIEIDRQSIYVDGEWIEPTSGESSTNLDSNTEQPLGRYVLAGTTEVDRAVSAARAALNDQNGWGGYSGVQRAAVMRRFADAIERRRVELGELVAREVGTPIQRSVFSNSDTATALLRFYADIIEDTDLEDLRPAGRGHSLVRREAIGVVGMIAAVELPA